MRRHVSGICSPMRSPRWTCVMARRETMPKRSAASGKESPLDESNLSPLRRAASSLVPGTVDRFTDQASRLFHATPAQKLHPLAGFQVLVVKKEVLDLV